MHEKPMNSKNMTFLRWRLHKYTTSASHLHLKLKKDKNHLFKPFCADSKPTFRKFKIWSHFCVFKDYRWTCEWLTKATAIARHDHERAQTSSDDALRPSQWRLFERACVLVKKRVDAVGWWRTAVPHYRLCRRETFSLWSRQNRTKG